MFYYLVDDKDTIVGTATQWMEASELPVGLRSYKDSRPELLNWTLVDGVAVDPESLKPAETGVKFVHAEPINFWNSDLFRKARIKANKDPLMAMQVMIALSAEQRGDRKIYLGALKSIEDLLRKSDAVKK